MANLQETWVYLSASPLFHLTLTLIAFWIGSQIYDAAGRHPVLNPVLIAVMIIVAVLLLTGTDYGTYFQGAQFVHFLLGPATVSLAVPLYRQLERVKKSALALSISLITGSVTAILSAIGIGWLFGASPEVLASLAPKSATTPVAMGIAEQLGGIPTLTAVLVIVTGIIGAMLGPIVMTALGVRDMAARGLAMGTASHGIGTARAFQVDETAGAFSGLAMGLNALATALLLPLIWGLLS